MLSPLVQAVFLEGDVRGHNFALGSFPSSLVSCCDTRHVVTTRKKERMSRAKTCPPGDKHVLFLPIKSIHCDHVVTTHVVVTIVLILWKKKGHESRRTRPTRCHQMACPTGCSWDVLLGHLVARRVTRQAETSVDDNIVPTTSSTQSLPASHTTHDTHPPPWRRQQRKEIIGRQGEWMVSWCV